MAKPLYHAPSDCPVCGDDLITTRKGCPRCGTELAGEFAHCEFCRLGSSELELLKVFLGSRGNLREVEKHLQVSYPTARTRLDAVLAKLGLDSPGEPAQHAESDEVAADPDDTTEQNADAAELPDQQILVRVARGEISPEVAAQLLGH